MEVREGYKNTEVGIIPEDWDVHSLFDEIDTLVAGVSVNSVNEKIDIIHDIAILKTSCVSKGSFYPSEAKKIITSDINRAKHNPKKDHIIISRMNTPDLVGECGYVEADFPNLYLPDRLWMMEFKKASNINSRWLNYILNTYVFRQKIRELGSGTSGSMKNISKSKLLELLIPYPDGAEQTAIATALSDADALINSLEKLIAKKRNIKQGAMQKLLQPKEGWEVKKLGEISEMFSGGTPLTTNANYYNGGIPWVVIADITKAGKYIAETEKTISNEGLLNSSAKLFRSGVLLFAMYASIGKTTIALMDTTCNQAILGIQPYSINKEYLYYFLSFNERKFATMGQTGTQSNLSKDMVQKIEIPYPIEEEQTYIATILSDMDSEINALESKLEKYRKVKLGMMQNLLTGKIRLI